MISSHYLAACAAAVAACLAIAPPCSAQVARSGGGAGSAQLMQQMQQLASERTALQAENAKLKKDLEDARKERDALKKGQSALEQRAKVAESSVKQTLEQRQSQEQELTQTKDKLQQLVAKFRETLQNMHEIETDRVASKQSLSTREQELKVCVDHNRGLYKLNQQVLTRLEHQGVWSRVAASEPFTKIKRVQLENLVDEYKGQADDLRLKGDQPQPVTAPVPATPVPRHDGG